MSEHITPITKTTAEDVVNIARSWLGTKYVHQASLKGVGCDCLGLLRGVWEEIYHQPTETPPPYTSLWAENTKGQEPMLDAANKYLNSARTRNGRKSWGSISHSYSQSFSH